MRNIVIFIILNFLLCCSLNLSGQTKTKDSIRHVARADVKQFNLNSDDLKVFRKNRNNEQSDLFKPNSTTTKNVALLTDSAYVKYFRERTYQKMLHKHTVGHYFLIGGISVIGSASLIVIGFRN